MSFGSLSNVLETGFRKIIHKVLKSRFADSDVHLDDWLGVHLNDEAIRCPGDQELWHLGNRKLRRLCSQTL